MRSARTLGFSLFALVAGVGCGSTPDSVSSPQDAGSGPAGRSVDASVDGAAASDSSAPDDGGGGRALDDGEASLDAIVNADAALNEGASSDGAVNPTPTISGFIGTNVSADLPRVDVAYQLNAFDTPAAQQDTNGYPLAGVPGKSSTDIGFVLPSGVYKISYVGTGQLAVSGIGQLAGPWQLVNGEQRSAVQITGSPGAFGQFLTLQIMNAAGQSVHDVHIFYPGFDYDTKTVFLPGFLRIVAPFRALRFMDWENTNGSTLANWSDRPAATHFGAALQGQPYEHIVELVNETGKDAWVTVPEHATDDFAHQFARFLATNLDFARIQAARNQAGFTTPFQLIVENSNETWNMGFTAYTTFLAAAKLAPARYSGVFAGTFGPTWQSQSADLMHVAQYEADRLVQIAAIFRQEFGAVGMGGSVAPVLSGWAIGAAYSDEGLQFIKANYGDPKTFIRYVAIAPYFGPDDAKTGTLASLFASMSTNIAAADTTLQDFAKLANGFGLTIVAYEGGQGISGPANLTIKHLSQHDQRMFDAYTQHFSLWKKNFGSSFFMHFSLAGTPGLPENIYQYGFWGSIIGANEDPAVCAPNLPTLLGTESVASVVHHCPKYRALISY
jgi:hypothetical protein